LFTCEFSSNDGEIVTMGTPQQSKQISLGNEHVCVETEMRGCQENSLFLSPTSKKLHNSIEKASNSTQTLYTTNSLREARKNIVASVDHILQHDFIQENPIAVEFVSTLEKEVQNIKEHFSKKICLLWDLRLAKTMNYVIYCSRIRNKRFLISNSRDMEDRVNWCVILSLLIVMYKYVSKEMRTKVILEFMCINYTDAFIDYYIMNIFSS
jgi:hypothetical protein